jgi:hypothetical protein
MSATLSPHEKATAVLSLGLLAAIMVFAIVLVGSAVVLIGKGGAAVVGSIWSSAASVGPTASHR